MTTSIQPHLFYPLVDINKKLIPPELNSPSSVGMTATPSSVSVLSQPLFSSASVNKDPIYFNDINTLFVCSRMEDGLAQDYFKGELNTSSTAMQSSHLKSPTDKDNKTETLLCLILVALVKDYILQSIVFNSAVGVPVRDDIFQLTAFSLARAFKYLKVYVSNQFTFLWKKTNSYKDFVNMFFTMAKLHFNNY